MSKSWRAFAFEKLPSQLPSQSRSNTLIIMIIASYVQECDQESHRGPNNGFFKNVTVVLCIYLHNTCKSIAGFLHG